MKKNILSIFIHLILILATSLTLIPMCWLVAATFKHPDYVFSYTFFGPVYSEPETEDFFLYEFWNEFDENYTGGNASEAFSGALNKSLEVATGKTPDPRIAETIIAENPTLFNEQFPDSYNRETSNILAQALDPYLPGDYSPAFTNHFHEGYLENYDPMYVGLPLENPRAFMPALSWANFNNLFTSIPFGRYVINSFFISCATVLIQLFFSSLAGFALAKYNFAGKKPIMTVMLLTMMIPGQVMLAPLYELIYKMGLVDSYFGLIVPGAVNVFGIFLFRQSMMHIPTDLLEAGRVDGCSEFRIYWNIVLPVSRPMIGAFTLIAFMGAWNNYLWPQIILHTQERFTLPIGLSQMVSAYEGNYGALMAGTFMSVLPVVVLFFMLQKEFISGLTAGAVKA